MYWKSRGWTLVNVLLLTMAGLIAVWPLGAAAQITTTLISDTVYHADGTPATGTVIVSWGAFTAASGETVPTGSSSATISSGGALSIALAPNAGSTPIGSYYTAVFHLDDGSVSREYWVGSGERGHGNTERHRKHGSAHFRGDADGEQVLRGHGDCRGSGGPSAGQFAIRAEGGGHDDRTPGATGRSDDELPSS